VVGDVVVKMFTFAISSPDEFLIQSAVVWADTERRSLWNQTSEALLMKKERHSAAMTTSSTTDDSATLRQVQLRVLRSRAGVALVILPVCRNSSIDGKTTDHSKVTLEDHNQCMQPGVCAWNH